MKREAWRAQEHNSRAYRVRDLPFPLGVQPGLSFAPNLWDCLEI